MQSILCRFHSTASLTKKVDKRLCIGINTTIKYFILTFIQMIAQKHSVCGKLSRKRRLRTSTRMPMMNWWLGVLVRKVVFVHNKPIFNQLQINIHWDCGQEVKLERMAKQVIYFHVVAVCFFFFGQTSWHMCFFFFIIHIQKFTTVFFTCWFFFAHLSWH